MNDTNQPKKTAGGSLLAMIGGNSVTHRGASTGASLLAMATGRPVKRPESQADGERGERESGPRPYSGYRAELARKLRAAEKSIAEAGTADEELARHRAIANLRREIEIYDRGRADGERGAKVGPDPDEAA